MRDIEIKCLLGNFRDMISALKEEVYELKERVNKLEDTMEDKYMSLIMNLNERLIALTDVVEDLILSQRALYDRVNKLEEK